MDYDPGENDNIFLSCEQPFINEIPNDGRKLSIGFKQGVVNTGKLIIVISAVRSKLTFILGQRLCMPEDNLWRDISGFRTSLHYLVI